VEIDGKEYELNTDYEAALYTILAFEDNDLAQGEKVDLMLDNLFFEMPENLQEAAEKAQWFLNGGKESIDTDTERRLFSFSQDSSFIYSAFNQTHRIDLQEENIHWWKFLSLFMDLGQDTTYCQLVGLRSRFYAGSCTEEEKEHIAKIADIFYIKNSTHISAEEREAERLFKENYEKAKAARDAARSK
jgi:hypothetical protein